MIVRLFSRSAQVFFCVLAVALVVACQQEPATTPTDDGAAASKAENTDSEVAEMDDRTLRDAQSALQSEKQAEDGESAASNDQPQVTAEMWDANPDAGPAELTIDLGPDWTRVSPNHEIWLNAKTKQVVLGGKVCLNAGPLEMFICPRGTKEHESIISANVQSNMVHASLLALDVNPGKTATFGENYRPAYGPEIKIELKWKDQQSGETKTASSTDMIKNMKTGQPMEAKWVFGGSLFYENPDTGHRTYLGDAGELVCLSNFSTATIDINVVSSQDNENLLFEANTENIPPVGTQIYAFLTPGEVIGKPAGDETPGQESDAGSAEETQAESSGDQSSQDDGKQSSTNGELELEGPSGV